jgi:hypothetical protein
VKALRRAAVCLAAMACAQTLTLAQPQTAASEAAVDRPEDVNRVRAALERPPAKLTLQDRTPDFSVHIEKRRPMQDIFDKPPWQLPPIGWQPPSWGTGLNLLSVVSYVAKEIRDAKYAHDERKAREEVQQSISGWCAAQENGGRDTAICR